MVKTKQRITLEEIMLNAPREVEVEGYNSTVLVRDPTKRDRIDARNEAMKSSLWEDLTEEQRTLDILDRVVFRTIVEPEITEETYLNAREGIIRDIIDSVLVDYTKRLRAISDKRQRTLKDFLELMKVKNP